MNRLQSFTNGIDYCSTRLSTFRNEVLEETFGHLCCGVQPTPDTSGKISREDHVVSTRSLIQIELLSCCESQGAGKFVTCIYCMLHRVKVEHAFNWTIETKRCGSCTLLSTGCCTRSSFLCRLHLYMICTVIDIIDYVNVYVVYNIYGTVQIISKYYRLAYWLYRMEREEGQNGDI